MTPEQFEHLLYKLRKIQKLLTISAIGILILPGLLCVTAHQAAAATPSLYHHSLITFATASAFDAHSSWNHLEANPLLRNSYGRFGAKGIAVKAGVVVGWFVAQRFILRRWPKSRKALAFTNFGWAGAHVGFGVRNRRLK